MSGTPNKQGWLTKMGGSVKSWKRRYFIFHNYNLDYYKDSTLKEHLGTIPIIDSTVTLESAGEYPGFYFMIRLPASSGAKRGEFLIYADTEQERADWIKAIQSVNVVTCFKNELQAALKVNPKYSGAYLPIPYFITKAIQFLDQNALKFEGLYRLNGSSQKIDSLVTAINQNVPVEFSDAHCTTGLIKLYMRTLKTPILLYENMELLKKIAGSTEDQQIPMLRKLIRSLPLPNYIFLAYFFSHLLRVNANAQTNLMNVKAITVCIGPSLIWTEEGKPNDPYTESNIQQTICTLMLEHYTELFSNCPLVAYSPTGHAGFFKLTKPQDTSYPLTLNAPVNSIVQAVVIDKASDWTICVYNEQWACVHLKDLQKVDSKQIVMGLASQKAKWQVNAQQRSRMASLSPVAVELYDKLLQKLNQVRAQAAQIR